MTLNVDFEINQMVQEEIEVPDGNVTKRRRKSCLEERKHFHKKKITRTILLRKKIGRRHVDGCGKAGTENGGIMCQTNVQKQRKKTL